MEYDFGLEITAALSFSVREKTVEKCFSHVKSTETLFKGKAIS